MKMKKDQNTNFSQPESRAEELVWQVFRSREQEADVPIARLRLERQLASAPARQTRPRVRPLIKAAAFMVALLIIGGWATTLPVAGWDDGQQITVLMPDSFVPASYPYWVAVFSSRSEELGDTGAHSIVVDYKVGEQGEYYLQIGILGTNYSEANEWLRQVMGDIPELAGRPYTITQPLVPYRATVRDMLAHSLLGNTEQLEENVVRAWLSNGTEPQHVYVVSRTVDYAKRVAPLER